MLQLLQEQVSDILYSSDFFSWHCSGEKGNLCNLLFLPVFITQLSCPLAVSHNMPWRAVVMAKECYDPSDFGPDDEIEEVDEGEGVKVWRRKDWFRYLSTSTNLRLAEFWFESNG